MVKWVAAGRIIKTTAATPRITRSDSKSVFSNSVTTYTSSSVYSCMTFGHRITYVRRKIKGHIIILYILSDWHVDDSIIYRDLLRESRCDHHD